MYRSASYHTSLRLYCLTASILVALVVGGGSLDAAPSQRASLSLLGMSRVEALGKIAKAFAVTIYGREAVDGRVTLRLRSVTLDEALSRVLAGSRFAFKHAAAAVIISVQTAPTATPTPNAPTVLAVSLVPAASAARELRALYPQARIDIDSRANALIVVAPPADLATMRGVLQGIDVRSPLKSTTEAVPVHLLKPTDVAGHLRPLYPTARVQPGPNHSILITAPPADLAQIKGIIAALDAPTPPPIPPSPKPPSNTEAIHLTQARASSVARQLAGALPNLRVQVAGDAIIVTGSPDDMPRATALIAVLDQPPNGVQFTQIYRLHTLDAQSVADLVGRSFVDVRVSVDKTDNAITILASASEQKRIADAVAQLDASGPGGAGAAQQAVGPAGGFELYTLRAGLPGVNGAASTSATDIAQTVTQALQQSAPDLHITVAPNQQQLILVGNPFSVRIAKDLIGQLDVAQKLVILDTEILEVDETVAKDLGVSLPQPVISTTYSEVSPPPDALGNTQRLLGLQALQRTPLSLPLQLNLLVQHGNARVLADPRITTISGRTATIRAGDTIAIETTTGGGAGTIASTQLQTFQTGVTLDITPIVNADNYVSVTLHPVVNSETGILNGIPQISTRDTQTTVALREDQTLVIGGLIQDSTTRTENRIPVLGDLPLIGSVFREHVLNHQRNELVITVTPHIVVPGETEPFPRAPLPTIPAALALPTLAPGTTLPLPRPAPVEEPERELNPSPPLMSAPREAGTPAPSATPAATPTAFAQTNTYTFGQPPQNNFAGPGDAVQIFYVQFSPTVLRNGTPVKLAAVTTTNVAKLTVGYGGFTNQVAQNGPGKWLSTFPFSTAGLPVAPATIQLQLTASRLDGTSSSVSIPVSIAP